MGYLGIGELQLFELPRRLYSVPFLFPLGLPGRASIRRIIFR